MHIALPKLGAGHLNLCSSSISTLVLGWAHSRKFFGELIIAFRFSITAEAGPAMNSPNFGNADRRTDNQ